MIIEINLKLKNTPCQISKGYKKFYLFEKNSALPMIVMSGFTQSYFIICHTWHLFWKTIILTLSEPYLLHLMFVIEDSCFT